MDTKRQAAQFHSIDYNPHIYDILEKRLHDLEVFYSLEESIQSLHSCCSV